MNRVRAISNLIGHRATVVTLIHALVLTTAVSAQQRYGALVGNVTDATGAALPGASVTVTQLETNLAREVVTNANGS